MKALKQSLAFWRNWAYSHGALLFVIATAAVFRLLLIDEAPGGLFPDEAANGLDVNLILEGQHQPFYERNNGRESLFFYILTPFVLLFGRTPFAHHLTSGLIGVAVVTLTYLLARRWYNPRVAFIASFLAAVSSWYVTLSRTAFRANIAPLCTLLFFYFATRVVQSKSRKDYWLSSIFAGISFSLGFYTYISYRMMIPLLIVSALAVFIYDYRQRDSFSLLKKYWGAILAGLSAAMLTIVPLALFFAKNPQWIVGRSGQVSIFSPELNNGDPAGTFLSVLGKTVMGFFAVGDQNFRHNVAGEPFLSYFISPLFALGLIFLVIQSAMFVVGLIKKKSETEYQINFHRLTFFILTLWFLFMLAPEVLTAEGIPHGLRLIGVIPVVFIIPALFIEELIGQAPHRLHLRKKLTKIVIVSALAILLIAEFVIGARLYFGVAANSPEYHYAFRADLTTVSEYINERNDKNKTYLILDGFSNMTVEYMTTWTNHPYHRLESGQDSEKLVLVSGDQVIFAQSTMGHRETFENNHPEAKLKEIVRNRWDQEVMATYEQP